MTPEEVLTLISLIKRDISFKIIDKHSKQKILLERLCDDCEYEKGLIDKEDNYDQEKLKAIIKDLEKLVNKYKE